MSNWALAEVQRTLDLLEAANEHEQWSRDDGTVDEHFAAMDAVEIASMNYEYAVENLMLVSLS